MVAKRVSRPVQKPADAARDGVGKLLRRPGAGTVKAAVKKAVAKKVATKAVVKKAVTKKAVTKAVAKKPPAAEAPRRIRDGVEARKRTVAKTQRLVDQTAIAADEGDAIAETSIERLRAAKAPGAPHRKVPAGRVRRSAVDRLDDPPPATGSMLIDRVSRAIERELSQIEVIVGNHHVPPRQRTEAERRARTLASLARTLREVMTLRAGDRKARGEDDDAVPRDLTQLRLELARRMDQLVTEAKAAHPEPPE